MVRSYVGFSTSLHDPAVAIVDGDGQVVYAEATERYLQNKRGWHSAPDGFLRLPALIRRHCPPNSELVLANNWSESYARDRFEPIFQRSARLAHAIQQPSSRDQTRFPQERDLLLGEYTVMSRMTYRFMRDKELFGSNLMLHTLPAHKLHGYTIVGYRSFDHHLTHAAMASFLSPFAEAAVAILDGVGEGRAVMLYTYADGRLTPLHDDDASDQLGASQASLGGFYSQLCAACGFDWLGGEEWKVMGLAPYGKRNDAWYDLLRGMFEIEKCRLTNGTRRGDAIAAMREASIRAVGRHPLESADLAFTGQHVFEEVAAALLSNLAETTGSKHLVFAGGCALNSVFNGKITELTPFARAYVPSAPGDDGTAVGAALLAYCEDTGRRYPHTQQAFTTPYLGDRLSAEVIENLQHLGRKQSTLPAGKTVSQYTAECLAAGKLVGWAQGRAEFGPRALGNRSILADPRSPSVKETINARVKFREEFRPFAPAILHEHGPAYFEHYQETPYMERALRFKPEAAAKVPGVVHEDGTGRLQTVKRAWNERYYDLIEHFYRITGVPVILNTSFNIMGKPIIHSVEDAIAVFYTTGLDVLVLDDVVLEK